MAKKIAHKESTARSAAPGDDALAELGAARRYWDEYVERVKNDVPEAEFIWKEYAGKTGRQCVIRMKDRNLAYLKPGDGGFLASIALSDAAVVSLAKAKLPKALIEEIQASPMYPEGRAARVKVESRGTFDSAMLLLSIKVKDVAKSSKRRKSK